MRFLITGRRMGKTIHAISWMRQNPDGVLVCINMAEAERLRQDNPDIFPHRFITVNDPKLKEYPAAKVAVDNLDMVLPRLLGVDSVDFATATGISMGPNSL